MDAIFLSDTVPILFNPVIPAVPEFGDWMLIIAVLGAFVAIVVVRRE